MSFSNTFNLVQDWEDVSISSDGNIQVAISSNDVYISQNEGFQWSRYNVKPWPPETPFPIGDPFWNITGTGVWFKDSKNFKNSPSSLSTFGQNNSNKSYSVYTEGFFDSGELDFYFRLFKRSAFDSVSLNFYVSRLVNGNLEKILFTGLSSDIQDSSWVEARYVLPNSGFYNFEWEYSQSFSTNPATGWIDSVLLPPRILEAPLKSPSGELLLPELSKTGELLYSNNRGNNFNLISNFDLDFQSLKIAKNPKYQAVSTSQQVYLSSDFGVGWNRITGLNITNQDVLSDIALSEDSKYIIVCSPISARINSNSGLGSWAILGQTANSVGVAISNNGAFQTIVRNQPGGQAGNFPIRVSNNFGESFVSVGPSKQWAGISMNGDGQYQTAIAEKEFLYITHDYGLTWSGALTGSTENWSDVKMSSNGQFQFASVLGGGLYLSTNYGLSWSKIDFIKNWRAVSLTDNANILAAVSEMDNIYYSENSGVSWRESFKISNWKDVDISTDGLYQLLINRSLSEVRVAYTNFYTKNSDPSINIRLNTVTGYGFMESSISGFGTGIITNPTGEQFQPAVIFDTGLLTGNIPSGSSNGVFTWNLDLTGNARADNLFLEPITGFTESSGIIEFLNSTGSGLFDGDFININNISLTYRTTNPSLPFEFSSPENLINIFNSGATGGFNNLDFGFSQNNIGITGYQIDNKLFLFSFARKGSLGNTIRLSRNSNNLDAIKIPFRFFIGGEDLRVPVSLSTGVFTRKGPLSIENSGVYSVFITELNAEDTTPGIVWEDTFTGGWNVLTGIFSQGDPPNLSFLNYNNIQNKFLNSGVIPSGNESRYTGLNIQFLKKRPYEISGNLALYILSGENFLYSGLLEG
jgi:hypothetical protein